MWAPLTLLQLTHELLDKGVFAPMAVRWTCPSRRYLSVWWPRIGKGRVGWDSIIGTEPPATEQTVGGRL